MFNRMMHELMHGHATLTTGIWGLAVVVAVIVVSNAILLGLVVALPADYFCRERSVSVVRGWRVAVRVAAIVAKNIFGTLILLLGIPLIMPGVPGPGLVLILIGLAMVDFPGKRRIEKKLLSYPVTLRTVNGLRRKFGRAPLLIEGTPSRCDPTKGTSQDAPG